MANLKTTQEVLKMIQVEEDYQIVKAPNQVDVGILIRFMRNFWSDSLVSDSKGEISRISEVRVTNLFSQKEFVIYKNRRALQSWEEIGYSTKNSKTALLVIIEEDGIFITYNQDEKSRDLISQINMAIVGNSNISRMPSLAGIARTYGAVS
jgi:DNA-binding transcriptional regulator YiaG